VSRDRLEYEDFTAASAVSAETKTDGKNGEYSETAEPAGNQIGMVKRRTIEAGQSGELAEAL